MKKSMVQKGSPEKANSSRRRSRWDSSGPKENPPEEPKKFHSEIMMSSDVYDRRFDPIAIPREDFPPLAYGFQDLERRTISLADGTSRTYFALPPDPPPGRGPLRPESGVLGRAPEEFREIGDRIPFPRDRRNLNDYEGGRVSPVKRKYEENGVHRGNSRSRGEIEEFRQSKQARYDELEENSVRRRRSSADGSNAAIDEKAEAVNRAFLRFSRMIYEDSSLKSNILEDGKKEPLYCIACGRDSKKFGDMHALIMHTYHSQNVDLRIDHQGLHKALCVLMGWDYEKAPETSKAYQSLLSDIAIKNREDLILWPPMLIIHKKNGRFDAIGSKDIESKLRDLGVSIRRWKPLGPETSAARFSADKDGLRDAERAADKLERESRGRQGWARAPKGSTALYGYLASAAELELLDEEGKNRALLRSRRDFSL